MGGIKQVTLLLGKRSHPSQQNHYLLGLCPCNKFLGDFRGKKWKETDFEGREEEAEVITQCLSRCYILSSLLVYFIWKSAKTCGNKIILCHLLYVICYIILSATKRTKKFLCCILFYSFTLPSAIFFKFSVTTPRLMTSEKININFYSLSDNFLIVYQLSTI